MKNKAYLYIIAGAALWGLIGLFVRMLNAQGLTAMEVVFLRVSTSALVMSIFLLPQLKQVLAIKVKDLWMFLGTGLISLTFFNYCYFNCIASSSLAVAALLLYTAPIFVMLMSLVLFKESFTKIKAVALVATFIGCACVTGIFSGSLNITTASLLYGLGSGIGYATYSIFGKYALEKYSSSTITAYTFYIAAICTLPLADFSKIANPALLNMDTLIGVLGLSIICAVIPYLLYTKGLDAVAPGQASIIATIEPFVAAGVGIIAFGEPLTMQKAVGMLLIFGAIVLLNWPKGERE